ncbi:olfactory receptor 5V1-like [Microcaecilia unicolor]|uniref:Olfactory receptor n=1 Tax=Microcaecilia unicolor TaxID=1415580 RepID=A0A6P7X7Z1_9AMPH|nr:olfactory receptor 5V1-like [Microcaecilia unicolor]
MYFFLRNLSIIDISYASDTVPKLLDILLRKSQCISMTGCFTQTYFFICFACVEYILLSVMAYDRYSAICQPLRYAVTMNERVCKLMVTGTWTYGFLAPVIYTVLLSQFSYCGSHVINHFFCDVSALLQLSCSSTYAIEYVTYCAGVFVGMPCFIATLASYICIISAILRIRSTEGRLKAFSTCSSHLTVVILFYGTLMGLYVRPTSMQSMEQNKLFAVLYNVLIPMFNPIIYSLKNKEVKKAVRKLFTRK